MEQGVVNKLKPLKLHHKMYKRSTAVLEVEQFPPRLEQNNA